MDVNIGRDCGAHPVAVSSAKHALRLATSQGVGESEKPDATPRNITALVRANQILPKDFTQSFVLCCTQAELCDEPGGLAKCRRCPTGTFSEGTLVMGRDDEHCAFQVWSMGSDDFFFLTPLRCWLRALSSARQQAESQRGSKILCVHNRTNCCILC